MSYSEKQEMVDSESEKSFNTSQIKYFKYFFLRIFINLITKSISLSFSLSLHKSFSLKSEPSRLRIFSPNENFPSLVRNNTIICLFGV